MAETIGKRNRNGVQKKFRTTPRVEHITLKQNDKNTNEMTRLSKHGSGSWRAKCSCSCTSSIIYLFGIHSSRYTREHFTGVAADLDCCGQQFWIKRGYHLENRTGEMRQVDYEKSPGKRFVIKRELAYWTDVPGVERSANEAYSLFRQQ
jgi:hypothetical protein